MYAFILVWHSPVVHLDIWIDSHLVHMMIQSWDDQKDQLLYYFVLYHLVLYYIMLCYFLLYNFVLYYLVVLLLIFSSFN